MLRILKYLIYIALILGLVTYLNHTWTEPVYLRYGNWEIEPNLSTFFLALLLAFFIAYLIFALLFALIRIPKSISRIRDKTQLTTYKQIIAELIRNDALDNDSKISKTLEKLASDKKLQEHLPVINLALYKHSPANKKKHERIQSASQSEDTQIKVHAQLYIALKAQNFQEAVSLFDKYDISQCNNLSLLDMLLNAAQKCNNLTMAITISERIDQLSDSDHKRNELIAYLIANTHQIEQLKQIWRKLGTSILSNNQPNAIKYARKIFRLGAHKNAKKILFQLLKQPDHKVPELFTAVAELNDEELTKLALKTAEQETLLNSQSAPMQFGLGRVYESCSLYGKAELCYRQAIAIGAQENYFYHLISMLDRIGKPESEIVNLKHLRTDWRERNDTKQ